MSNDAQPLSEVTDLPEGVEKHRHDGTVSRPPTVEELRKAVDLVSDPSVAAHLRQWAIELEAHGRDPEGL